ncbi:plasmid segregation protein ParM [Klebsiella aerogenes]|nr:plasmid segregation protein ParM [Klebsiella aerogenes]
MSVSRIKKVLFPGASSLTRGFALSLGCGEHCWLAHNYLLDGRKYTYDPVSEAVINTTHIEYQYSDINVLAVPRNT